MISFQQPNLQKEQDHFQEKLFPPEKYQWKSLFSLKNDEPNQNRLIHPNFFLHPNKQENSEKKLLEKQVK
jgi:hypothetical protein